LTQNILELRLKQELPDMTSQSQFHDDGRNVKGAFALQSSLALQMKSSYQLEIRERSKIFFFFHFAPVWELFSVS
jgi:hypothetical protein